MIVAAYRSVEWIAEALGSIERQREVPGVSYELRVGVDSCGATSRELTRLGQGHWCALKNVGPYVMRNSLIGLAPASVYAMFDADDVMDEDYLDELLALLPRRGIAGAARRTFTGAGQIVSRRSPYHHGVCLITAEAWDQLGGYRPWPIAADHDLIMRAKAQRIPVRTSTRPLYGRRRHEASLTRDRTMGFGTPYRNEFKQRTLDLIEAGEVRVSPQTTELEWRE